MPTDLSVTAIEILQVLAEHWQEPVDGVALFMLLNTVAGGHYQERHSEAAIAADLRALLARGLIAARNAAEPGNYSPADLIHSVFSITPRGRGTLNA